MSVLVRSVMALAALVLALVAGYIGHDAEYAAHGTAERATLAAVRMAGHQGSPLPTDAGVVVVKVEDGTQTAAAGDTTLLPIPGSLLSHIDGKAPGTTEVEDGWVAVVAQRSVEGIDEPGSVMSRTSPPGAVRSSEVAAVAAPDGLAGSPSMLLPVVLLAAAVVLVALLAVAPLLTRRRHPDSTTSGPQQPWVPLEAAHERNERAPVTASVPNSHPDSIGDFITRVIEVRDLIPQRALAARLDAGLSEVGVDHFDPVGQRFDDTRHHVVGVRHPTDPTLAGTVAATERVGYLRGGVLFRPADVVVYDAQEQDIPS